MTAHGRPAAAHRRPAAAGQRDTGAVAVVVALVVSLVLLPVAALALDLGNTYTIEAALQRAADEAALAGARALAVAQRTTGPGATTQAGAIAAAAAAAVAVLCADPLLDGGGSAQGPWHAACADPAWAFDHEADPTDPGRRPNGGIEFYAGPADGPGHRFTAGQVVTGGDARLVTGIRVVTPPATIAYGFAGVFGASRGTAQRAATAELRTVLPARDANGTTGEGGSNLPLYVTTHDVGGAWCARSAPRESWLTARDTESNHPTGTACDPSRSPSVPRGYLTASEQVVPPVPGSTVHLAPQRWPQVARLRALTPILFGSAGRLVQPGCPGGNTSTTGGYTGVESAHLADFAAGGETAAALEAIVLAGAAPAPGSPAVLSPDILRCGRLALVPVLDLPAPPDQPPGPGSQHDGLSATTYQVQDVRLLWLDSTVAENDPTPVAGTSTASTCLQRGFYWENATTAGYCPPRDDQDAPLRAITGYVLDPRLLPATVGGQDAANTTDYFGAGLPATARLVHDIGDPPAT